MYRLTALLLLLFLLIAPVTAEAEKRTILIGTLPEGWPPYMIIPKDKSQPYGGIMLDVINEVCSVSGYRLEVVLSPEKRSHLLLSKQEIDAYTEAREWVEDPENYLWSDTIIPSEDVLIFPTNHPVHFETIADLYGLSIAAPLGYVYPALEPCFAKGKVLRQTPTDSLGSLRMVSAGHANAAVGNQLVAQWLINHSKDLKPEEFAFSKKKVGTAEYRFMFVNTPKMRRFLKVFNEELALMRADGRFQHILDQYN